MTTDEQYLNIILKRVRVCKNYKPKFGQGQGVGLSLHQFRQLYQSDVFYSWFGLDNPLMYAAHKAAGGITSVYRQIGMGCEELFRQILMDQFELSLTDATWSYQIPTADSSKSRTLSLDGRIELDKINNPLAKGRVVEWLKSAASVISIDPTIASALKGVVFEVRQGYKSKDSKRQNADIANAATAYSQGYLPAAVVLSTQMDSDIVYRYQAQRWLILLGFPHGSTTQSTYSFMREVIGYDLAAFFERNTPIIRAEVDDVLEALLNPDD